MFEQFLYVALGEELGLSQEHWKRGKGIYLDKNRNILVQPDLSWWTSGSIRGEPRPIFVGDAKYKKLERKEGRDKPDFRHADIYQMLAYCAAADLPYGLLIYASGEGEPDQYEIKHVGKTVEVESLDLSGTPDDILNEVDRLGNLIRMLSHDSIQKRAA